MSPQAGLYTGIIGGFLVSAFGGSRVQIGGPAGAFVDMVAMLVQNQGVANLLICTMLVEVVMFALGTKSNLVYGTS